MALGGHAAAAALPSSRGPEDPAKGAEAAVDSATALFARIVEGVAPVLGREEPLDETAEELRTRPCDYSWSPLPAEFEELMQRHVRIPRVESLK